MNNRYCNYYCNSCDSCNYCNSCDSCDSCNYCNSCDSCDYCNYCDSCDYCNYCNYCKNLVNGFMCKNLIFEKKNPSKYWIFNKEVTKEEWGKRFRIGKAFHGESQLKGGKES